MAVGAEVSLLTNRVLTSGRLTSGDRNFTPSGEGSAASNIKKRAASDAVAVWSSKKSKTSATISASGVHNSSAASDSSDDLPDVITIAEAAAGLRSKPIKGSFTKKATKNNVVKTGTTKRSSKRSTAAPTPPPTPGPSLPAAVVHPDHQLFSKKLAAIPGPPVTLRNEIDDTPSPPTDFEFISEYRLSDKVPPYDKDFLWGCNCPESGCEDPEDCACQDNQDSPRPKFAYGKHGRAVRDNRMEIVECNERCSCGPECRNRVVQHGRQVPLEIFKTKEKGWGKSNSFLCAVLNWRLGGCLWLNARR